MLISIYFISLISILITLLYFKYNNKITFAISPAVGCLAAYGFVFVLYPLGEDFVRYKTAFIITLFILAYVSSAFLLPTPVILNLKCLRIHSPRKLDKLTNLVLAMQVVALVTAALSLFQAIQFSKYDTVLYSTYSTDPSMFWNKVRGVLANESYGIPVWVKLLSQFKYINYVAPLLFIVMNDISKKYKYKLYSSVAFSCCYPLFFLERSGVIRVVVLTLIFWIYWCNPKLKSIVIRIAILLVVAPLLKVVLYLRGQEGSGGDSIYNYFVGALGGIDSFISGSTGNSYSANNSEVYLSSSGYEFGEAQIGAQTFTELYNILNKLFDMSIDTRMSQEYISTPIHTNIYTGMRPFYQDFGLFGIVVVFIIGALVNVLFIKYISNKSMWRGYLVSYLFYVSIYAIIANNFILRDIFITYLLLLTSTKLTGTYTLLFETGKYYDVEGT